MSTGLFGVQEPGTEVVSRAAVFGCGTEDSGLRGKRVQGLGLRGLGVRV